MDWLDWTVRGAGATFGLLTLAFGLSRASAFTERDVSPFWWFAFAATGIVWAVVQVADWALPITTIVYLANGGDVGKQAKIGGRQVCLPGKSYDGFTWRIAAPSTVTVGGTPTDVLHQYAIGKGTWFINLSTTLVTADMYAEGNTIDFDALFAYKPEAFKVSSRYGKPFRMFSQSPLDRFYAADGDVIHISFDGPCPAESTSAEPH
jgi:hypothetical protein